MQISLSSRIYVVQCKVTLFSFYVFASPHYGPQPPSCVQQLLLDLQLCHAVPWNFDLKSNTINVYSKVWCLPIDVSILGYPRSMFALLLPLRKLHCTTRLYVMLGTYVMVNPPPSHHTMSLNLLRQLVMLAILRRRDIATTGTQTRQGLFLAKNQRVLLCYKLKSPWNASDGTP